MVAALLVLNPLVVYLVSGSRSLAAFSLLLDAWLAGAIAGGLWYLGRRRRAGLWLMAGFIGTLLPALVAGEVLLTWLRHQHADRLLGEVADIYVPDPELVYAHVPEARGRHASLGNFDVEYVIDAAGRKAIPEDPKAERTIHVFGDSFTFGYGVANEETWLNRLKARLGTEANVLNYGVVGYSIEQMLLRLARSTEQIEAGDLVVFAPVAADLERSLVGKSYVCGGLIRAEENEHFPKYEDGRWRQARLRDECNFLLDTVLANSPLPVGFGAVWRELGRNARHPEMIANADRLFAEAERLAAERGASFHVVFLATPEECARGAHDFEIEPLATEYASFLPFCPDDPEAVQALKFPYDGHWSAAGHSWAADVIYEILQELPDPADPARVAQRAEPQPASTEPSDTP